MPPPTRCAQPGGGPARRRAERARRLALVGLVAVLASCGPGPPAERLAEAQRQLVAARAEFEAVEARVQQSRDGLAREERELAAAREKLESAEGELARAQDEVERARARVDERATDVALFRAVQNALLERGALSEFAIRAEVANGVVTLRGEVERPSQNQEAIETARAVAGVDRVVDEIRVRGAAAAEG